jgi:hypothetical protein
MDFSQALLEIKRGNRVYRAICNSAVEFIFQAMPRVEINAPSKDGGCITSIDAAQYYGANYHAPVLCRKTAMDEIAVGWLPSQEDIFADDWQLSPQNITRF